MIDYIQILQKSILKSWSKENYLLSLTFLLKNINNIFVACALFFCIKSQVFLGILICFYYCSSSLIFYWSFRKPFFIYFSLFLTDLSGLFLFLESLPSRVADFEIFLSLERDLLETYALKIASILLFDVLFIPFYFETDLLSTAGS